MPEASEIIAKALTKKFSSKIPKGYAFRLPTEAEWEYVAKAGKGDKGVFGKYLLGKDVERYIVDESAAWNEVVKRHPIFKTEDGIRLRNNFGYKVATKSPNEWGVFDLYDKRISEATLDMINRSGPKGWQWFWFNYEDVEVDPWRCEERSSEQGAFRANVVRGVADRRSNGGMISAGKWTAHKEDLIWRFRFVIAPDTSQLNKYPRDSNDLSATAKFKTDGNRNMKDSKKYCVIDISKGSKASKYPVTFMAEEPKGGWTDEYKGTKLVLRKIPAGTILIEGQKKEFEKEFYAGVFEVTQKQLELVTGKASWEKNHVMYGFNRPAVNVDFEMIRGKGKGASVDNDSFIGLLRKRTGLNIDLPTVSEWIYFGRAGSESPFNNGGSTEDDLKMLGRYKGNKNDGKGGYADGPSAVGMYIPNTWGIYDIHGGVSEWCLDNGIEAPIRNPKWGEDKVVEKQRVVMGGHWDSNFSKNQYSGWVWPLDAKKWYMGFRIVAK